MSIRRPLLRVAGVSAIVAVLLAVGGANGVGPLAHVTPADQVTDPREMLARSLQSVIDASSVHLDITLSGQAPGAPFGREEPTVTLDGTEVVIDVRPQDARSHVMITSPAFGVVLESDTLWDTLAYRSSGGPWTRASLGSVVGRSGIDANPLTLVDRLRAWLAAPGAPSPTVTDVPCAAPSGSCHEIRIAAGSAPGEVLARLFPAGDAASVGPTATDVVLQVDAQTLRPVHLVLDIRNADGSLAITVTADASGWDDPTVLPDPPEG